MAKKKTKKTTNTTYTGNFGLIKLTAFWGIIISGIAGIITIIVRCLAKWAFTGRAAAALGSVAGVMTLIANLALFISVFLAGYAYSRGRNKNWRTLFWVFAILAFLGILGFNVLIMF